METAGRRRANGDLRVALSLSLFTTFTTCVCVCKQKRRPYAPHAVAQKRVRMRVQ